MGNFSNVNNYAVLCIKSNNINIYYQSIYDTHYDHIYHNVLILGTITALSLGVYIYSRKSFS